MEDKEGEEDLLCCSNNLNSPSDSADKVSSVPTCQFSLCLYIKNNDRGRKENDLMQSDYHQCRRGYPCGHRSIEWTRFGRGVFPCSPPSQCLLKASNIWKGSPDSLQMI